MVKTACRLHVLDVTFKGDEGTSQDVFEAIGYPDEIDLPQSQEDAPDTLERRLIAWGWATDGYGIYRRTGRLHTLGVWGDWTWFEDDEIFVRRIAPFVTVGSRIVFERAKHHEEDHNPEFWERDFEGWSFNGHTVDLLKVNKVVEYEWA